MSNSTYCEDHYEQPDWMKEIQDLKKQNKEFKELLAKKEKESIDKEKIRKEVERLRKIHQMKYQQLDADNSMSLVECGKRNLCNDLLSFIDSLQEEQKPAWSEEDEMRFNIIFRYLEGLPLSQNWLKSIKDRVQPQSQWKPSEVQMKLLKEACDEHWEPDGLDPLYTLYQDLKKLREEL